MNQKPQGNSLVGRDSELEAAYWRGFNDGEESHRSRPTNLWLIIVVVLGGGALFGIVVALLDAGGGTNPETGEPNIPTIVLVDSFLERLVWGAGTGVALASVLLGVVVGSAFAVALFKR